MPTILIVDRSDEDREMIRKLLVGQEDWTLLDVGSAAAARETLDESHIDLVLIDLTTSGPREERFLEHLREDRPEIPTILLTTDADAETAMVEALGIGAASYVPKSVLARDLAVTVERLLGLTGCRRRHARLLDCLTRTECRLVLKENDISTISVIIGHLVDTAEDFGITTSRNRMQIAVALDEALTNAIIHGNLEVSSRLREGDGDAYHALVRQRREQQPYRERTLLVTGAFRDGEARFTIRDEGPGFDVSGIPDPTDLTHIDKPHGRGLFLIRAFMDAVEFNSAGNEVTLVKRAVT